jgi:hypothetical protein
LYSQASGHNPFPIHPRAAATAKKISALGINFVDVKDLRNERADRVRGQSRHANADAEEQGLHGPDHKGAK